MQLGVFQLLLAEERQIRASLEYVTALTTYSLPLFEHGLAFPRARTFFRATSVPPAPRHKHFATCRAYLLFHIPPFPFPASAPVIPKPRARRLLLS